MCTHKQPLVPCPRAGGLATWMCCLLHVGWAADWGLVRNVGQKYRTLEESGTHVHILHAVECRSCWLLYSTTYFWGVRFMTGILMDIIVNNQ